MKLKPLLVMFICLIGLQICFISDIEAFPIKNETGMNIVVQINLEGAPHSTFVLKKDETKEVGLDGTRPWESIMVNKESVWQPPEGHHIIGIFVKSVTIKLKSFKKFLSTSKKFDVDVEAQWL